MGKNNLSFIIENLKNSSSSFSKEKQNASDSIKNSADKKSENQLVERPKMDGGIFGRQTSEYNKNGVAAVGIGEKELVCCKNSKPRHESFRTYSIILSNTAHYCKVLFKHME